MLSSTGPAVHLKEKKIPIIFDSPGVGTIIKQNPVVDSLYFLDPKVTSVLLQYHTGMGGPLAVNVGFFSDINRSFRKGAHSNSIVYVSYLRLLSKNKVAK
jgi:hypothetical protein